MKVAIIGGTGKLGRAIAGRLAASSHEVTVASREAAKAKAAVENMPGVQGMSNRDGAEWCDCAILTIPCQGQRSILEPLRQGLRGKIVIDSTVPLDPENFPELKTESGRSSAEEVAGMLTDSEVFAAFQTLSHRVLRRMDARHDALVAGPSGRKAEVLSLIRDMNLRAIDAGPLSLAGTLERLTVLLLTINKQNGVKESGIHITGIQD